VLVFRRVLLVLGGHADVFCGPDRTGWCRTRWPLRCSDFIGTLPDQGGEPSRPANTSRRSQPTDECGNPDFAARMPSRAPLRGGRYAFAACERTGQLCRSCRTRSPEWQPNGHIEHGAMRASGRSACSARGRGPQADGGA
jgi:hypothetical protein